LSNFIYLFPSFSFRNLLPVTIHKMCHRIESSLAVLMYNILTSHMQKIIQIYPCLLKLLRKQDTILKIGDLSTKN
jgi:hypothetical protein